MTPSVGVGTVLGGYCHRPFKPTAITVEQFLQFPIGLIRKQTLSGFKKLPIVLYLPKLWIGWNPLRFQGTRVSFLDFRKILFGRLVTDVEIGIFGQKTEVR